MDLDEIRERQGSELEFVASAYTAEEAWVSQVPGTDGAECMTQVNRRLLLRSPTFEEGPADAVVVLSLTMPAGYPLEQHAILQVEGSVVESSSRDTRKLALDKLPQLLRSCREVAESCAGSETVFAVLNSADEWVQANWMSPLAEESRISTESTSDAPEPLMLGRRLIYSHHIIANSKRRALADLAHQYRLGGYVKIGWPGIIIIEGAEEDCVAYYDQIRTMRWQYLVVRGEQQKNITFDTSSSSQGAAIDSQRRLPKKFSELGEDQMSSLASVCRQAGLEQLFMTAMKVYDRPEDQQPPDTEAEGDCDPAPELSHGTLVHVDHMNDAKGYRRWLQKACRAEGCFLVLLQCHSNDNTANRPLIFVAIIGHGPEELKRILKRWRTSRVDVDCSNRPCLERMMTTLAEEKLETKVTVDLVKSLAAGDFDVNCEDCLETIQKLGGEKWHDLAAGIIR